ncbi:MAG: glycosyltransferase [Candidatus Woesearchaeota archaeon]
MNQPRVLIACPTYEGMSYCLTEFLDAIKSLTYSNFEVLFVDNSKTDEYSKLIESKGYKVLRTVRFLNNRMNIVNSRNILRDRFIEGGYDYFFSVEQDVVLLPDAIERLLSHGKEIASGVYYKYKEECGFKVWYPVLMTACDKEGNAIVSSEPDCLIRNMYSSEVEGNSLIEIEAAGLGCVMVSRKVLDKIKFRVENGKKSYDDMMFSVDVKKNGFKMYADTSLKCKHLLDGKPEY